MLHKTLYQRGLCLSRVTNDQTLSPATLYVLLLEDKRQCCVVDKVYCNGNFTSVPDIRHVALQVTMDFIELVSNSLTFCRSKDFKLLNDFFSHLKFIHHILFRNGLIKYVGCSLRIWVSMHIANHCILLVGR